jgi:hypothetical protein
VIQPARVACGTGSPRGGLTISHQNATAAARGIRRTNTATGKRRAVPRHLPLRESATGTTEELQLLAGRYGLLSTTLLKRTAATAAAFVAIGTAGAMTPPIAGAATTDPAVSRSAHAAQAPQHLGYWCGRWHSRHWCYPGYPNLPYPYHPGHGHFNDHYHH